MMKRMTNMVQSIAFPPNHLAARGWPEGTKPKEAQNAQDSENHHPVHFVLLVVTVFFS